MLISRHPYPILIQWKNRVQIFFASFYNTWKNNLKALTLSWRRFLSYRNQSIDLQYKSMDWFLYHRNFRRCERVKYRDSLVQSNIEDTITMCEICTKLAIKTPELRHWLGKGLQHNFWDVMRRERKKLVIPRKAVLKSRNADSL